MKEQITKSRYEIISSLNIFHFYYYLKSKYFSNATNQQKGRETFLFLDKITETNNDFDIAEITKKLTPYANKGEDCLYVAYLQDEIIDNIKGYTLSPERYDSETESSVKSYTQNMVSLFLNLPKNNSMISLFNSLELISKTNKDNNSFHLIYVSKIFNSSLIEESKNLLLPNNSIQNKIEAQALGLAVAACNYCCLDKDFFTSIESITIILPKSEKNDETTTCFYNNFFSYLGMPKPEYR